MNSLPRIGQGLDVHPFATQDRPLVLAGITIPDAPGLAGHSDADVVCHAVADALLGACALGDLGERFGLDRPDVAGADSTAMLAEVVRDAQQAGFRLGNVDLTIVAQTPRLAVHRPAMRERLAEVLGLGVGDVSIKATTTDHLGSIGRSEGIACWATLLVAPI